MSEKQKPVVRIVLSYDAWHVLSWHAKNDRDLCVGTRREFKERDRLVEIGYLERVESVTGKERSALEREANMRCNRAVSELHRRPTTFGTHLEQALKSVDAASRELNAASRVCDLLQQQRFKITPAGRQFLKDCELKVSMAGEKKS